MQQMQDLPDVMDADLHASLGHGLADLQAFSGESAGLKNLRLTSFSAISKQLALEETLQDEFAVCSKAARTRGLQTVKHGQGHLQHDS